MKQKYEPSLSAQDELALNTSKKSFWERNSTSLKVLSLAALSGAGFGAIYTTASTSLPWFISFAANIGLDLSFLSSMSVPAASIVATSVGVGIVGTIYGVADALVNFTSFVVGRFSKQIIDSASASAADEDEDYRILGEVSPALSNLGTPAEPALDIAMSQQQSFQMPVAPIPQSTPQFPAVAELPEELLGSPAP